MESNWRWNVEACGLGGIDQLGGYIQGRWKFAAELVTPIEIIGLVWTHVCLRVGIDGSKFVFLWRPLTIPATMFPVGIPIPGARFPYGFVVQPD